MHEFRSIISGNSDAKNHESIFSNENQQSQLLIFTLHFKYGMIWHRDNNKHEEYLTLDASTHKSL